MGRTKATSFGAALGALIVMLPAGVAPAQEGGPDFDFPVTIAPVAQGAQTSGTLAPRAWMDATPSQVPIDRAGVLQFEPDPAGLGISGWSGGLAAEARVRIAFDRQGAPVDCAVISTETGWAFPPADWDRQSFVDGLCEEALAKARFEYASWFAVPLERGIIDVKVVMQRQMVPAPPVTLSTRETGLPVPLFLGWTAEGEPACRAHSARVSAKAGAAICEAFERSDRAIAMREAKGPIAPTVMVHVPGELASGGHAAVRRLPVQETGFGTRWPHADIAPASLLSDGDGRLHAHLSFHQIPVPARRAYSGQVKVLLGIAPDGRVRTCRPLESDTWPQVDNATCAALARHARYRFADKPDFTGLRYLEKTIRWQTDE